MSYDDIVSEVSTLSIDQKLILVAAIWDQISESPEKIPVPTFHENILKERSSTFDPEQNGTECRPWSDIRKEYGLR